MSCRKTPEKRKKEILNKAIIHFNRFGYYKTSLDRLAAEIGITKPAIYYHFKSKKNLFIELFHFTINNYLDDITANVSESKSAEKRIRYFTQKSEDLFHKNSKILRFCLEFIIMGTRDKEIQKEVTKLYQTRIKTLSCIIKEGQTQGELKKMDADSLARLLFFISMGFFLMSFAAERNFDPDTQHAINMKAIFEGLKNNS